MYANSIRPRPTGVACDIGEVPDDGRLQSVKATFDQFREFKKCTRPFRGADPAKMVKDGLSGAAASGAREVLQGKRLDH